MKLFRTERGPIRQQKGDCELLAGFEWNRLFDPDGREALEGSSGEPCAPPETGEILPPVTDQEIWGAGVTYDRSKTARMEEAEEAGGSDFYDRVYAAERPELFIKSTPSRTVGPDSAVRIRPDSSWSVPEPELTLAVDTEGSIFGYTIGNDVSARDIEGENPLYLPQAKVYDRSCALGPCIYLSDEEELPADTSIRLTIRRGGDPIFDEATTLSAMKRTPRELVRYLFTCNVFPHGVLLLTGTGIVPPDDFTLSGGETVAITVPPIGTLENEVVQ